MESGDYFSIMRHSFEQQFVRKGERMKEKMIMSLIMFSIGLFLIGHFSEDFEKQTSTAPEGVGHLPGQRAPDFRCKTDGGEELTLADLKGKHVFINFWASWCPPCRAEMPHIQNFLRKTKRKISRSFQ